ncbi:hypothetical protein SEA_BEARBQ_67 [Gordonia phage BearBQ]|nr:hypothetical protein SEA_BEARBQ_67 [Gordonia phage BearBQ]
MTCGLCGGSGQVGFNPRPGTPLFNLIPCPVCVYHRPACQHLQEQQ